MSIKKLTFTGMLTAVIFVFTMFVKIPLASGYLHLGDAFVYIGTLILGAPAVFAAAIGEGLADIAGGYAMYFPATVIVKCLIALPFVIIKTKGNDKLLNVKSSISAVIAGFITVFGYFIADLIIDKSYAVVDIPGNIIQAVGSAVAFIIIAAAFDKTKVTDKLGL